MITTRRLLICFFTIVTSACTSNSIFNDEHFAKAKTTMSPAGYFQFQINPWVSLHHFAFHLTRDNATDKKLRGRVPIRLTDQVSMSDTFRVALQPVFKAYEPYINQDLLFSEDLRAIGRTLSSEGIKSIEDKALASALKNIMPLYIKEYWSTHYRLNQGLLLELISLLTIYEADMATKLADEVSSAWGQEPILTDISVYANWAGAYTDNEPNRITLSSTDDEMLMGYAFELLFHEALHTTPLGKELYNIINETLTEAGIRDKRLWHHVLFYVSGKIAGDVLKIRDYKMYAEYSGIVKRKRIEYQAIKQAWQDKGSFSKKATQLAILIGNKQ